MKTETFDLCLAFHKELIRAELSQATVDNAKKYLVDGDKKLPGIGAQSRSRAKAFAETINGRLDTLKNWHKADTSKQRDIYKAAFKRVPADAVFDAVALVIDSDLKIGTAASQCGVNFQSVKVLKPRIERYNDYAEKLNLLTSGVSVMTGNKPPRDPKDPPKEED